MFRGMKKAWGWLGLVLAGCTSGPTEQVGSTSASLPSAGMTGTELCHALLIAPLDRKLASCKTADQGPELEAERDAIAKAHAECLEQIARPLEDARLALDEAKARACIAAVEGAGAGWVGPHAYVLDLAPFADCRTMLVPKQAALDVCTTTMECATPLMCTATDGTVGRCGHEGRAECTPRAFAFGIERRHECPPRTGCDYAPNSWSLADLGDRPDTPARKSPDVGRGKVTISGGVPVEVVERIVRQGFGRFRRCYEEVLRDKPELTGEIPISFTIKMDGSVGPVSAKAPEVPTSAVTCVTKTIEGLSFPVPEARPARVLYTLRLGRAAQKDKPSVPEAQTPKAVAEASWPRMGVCREPMPAKLPCRYHVDCKTDEYCSTGASRDELNRCLPRKPAGAACKQSSECKGRCLDETCVAWCGSG